MLFLNEYLIGFLKKNYISLVKWYIGAVYQYLSDDRVERQSLVNL